MATGLFFFSASIRSKLRLTKGTTRLWNTFEQAQKKRSRDREPANIDSILDKISAKGYDNLSTTEKRILEHYSRKQKEEPEE